MKILHTSDWHLGAMFHSQKRNEEFDKVLEWLLDIIKKENIEAIIIAGDIFDSNLPSNRATEQYYSFLAGARLAGVRSLIVTAGNHDSASFLEAPGEILKHLNVYVTGRISPLEPESVIIPLENSEGATAAVVCAVPYLRESDIRKAGSGEDIEVQENKRLEGILAYYQAVCARAEKLYPQIPVIVTGHFFADEANYYNSLQAVPVGKLPENISYLALGHLHAFQQIKSRINAWYSGSLLQMNFKEQPEVKKVLILDTDNLKEAPQAIQVPSFQRIETVSGSLKELKKKIKELQESGESVWLHAVNTGDFYAKLQSDLAELCSVGEVKLITCENSQANPALGQLQHRASEKLVEMTPRTVFERLLKDMTDEHRLELIGAFDEACRRLEEDDVNAE